MITNEIIEKLRRLQPQVKNWQGNVLLDPEKVDKRKLKEEEKKAAEDVKKAMASVLVTRRAKLTTESSIEDCISYFDAIRIFLDDFRFGREVVLSSEEAVLGINKVLRFLVKTLK
ncbi:hypothetical protein QYM36_014680 [Artemia franciscana]|uniref:Uncharacterized protein n=1 Tax=Artemia franciscana TaxID=6661 RepID=A0AA88HGP2_ARTSF|nr:hypothetical protein QYM36_014680 [Artemia franciscana]